jgi:hypothetical protein
MDGAKIRLSAKEMELVTNADWILTKNGIIEKGKSLFAELQDNLIVHLKSISPLLAIDAARIPPKISKGENYNGLPYLILDYPRIFDKQNIFAIRTLFWWGNFFSITLHLGGEYKKQYEEKCITALDLFKQHDFYFCINTDEWEHHFDSSNYIPVQNISLPEWKEQIEEKPFVKMAKKYSLHQWDNAVNILTADFKILTGILVS